MIWPPTPITISIALFVLLVVPLFIRAGWSGFDSRRVFEIVNDAFVPAFVLGNLFFPALWTTISFALKGGSFEDNLYPGATVGNFILWVFAVTVVAALVAASRFISRLRTLRVESGVDDQERSDPPHD